MFTGGHAVSSKCRLTHAQTSNFGRIRQKGPQSTSVSLLAKANSAKLYGSSNLDLSRMANSELDQLTSALQSAEVQRGQLSNFWRYVDRTKDILCFDVFAFNGDQYMLELTCDRYLDEPIHGRFVDPISRQCVSDAWPRGNPTFGGWFKWEQSNLFICWPGDRGGITHHPEWRGQQYWKKTSNPLHQYLEFISRCLNLRSCGYQPRKQQSHAA